MTPELNQSSSLPLSSISCRLPTHTTSSTIPTRSTGSLRVGVSRSRISTQVAIEAKMPTGMLMRKIHDQW